MSRLASTYTDTITDRPRQCGLFRSVNYAIRQNTKLLSHLFISCELSNIPQCRSTAIGSKIITEEEFWIVEVLLYLKVFQMHMCAVIPCFYCILRVTIRLASKCSDYVYLVWYSGAGMSISGPRIHCARPLSCQEIMVFAINSQSCLSFKEIIMLCMYSKRPRIGYDSLRK